MKTATLAMILLAAMAVSAANVKWTGAAGVREDGTYEWSNPENWDVKALPGEADVAWIQAVAGAPDPMLIDLDGATVTIAHLKYQSTPKAIVQHGKIRLANGRLEGNMSGYGVTADIEQLVDGQWYNDDSWGQRAQVSGRVSGSGTIIVNGNQNRNLHFFDAEVSVPKIQVSSMSTTANAGTRFYGTQILIQGGFISGSNGTSFTIPNQSGVDESHYGSFRADASLAFAGAGGAFSYTYAPIAVEEKLALALNGGRAAIYLSGATVPNSYVTVTNFTRSAGSYLRLQQTLGSAVPLQAENGQGMRIVDAANNPAGVLGVWAYDNNNYLLKVVDSAGTLGPGSLTDYATTFPTDGGDPWKLVRQTRDEALASDLDLYHWIDTSSGPRNTELGDHELTVYGGISYTQWGEKQIVATGSGKLRFANEDLFIYGAGSGSLDIAAPISWTRPAGSIVQYPSLVLPSTKASGLILSGKDEIRDYGNLNMGLSGLLVLEGDSDRVFHGELQDCVTVEQRGSGSVSFNGPYNGRSLTLRATGGRVIINNSTVSTSATVTNGASYVIGKDVSVSRAPVIWDDSYLEGFGEVATGLGTNQIKSDAGFAPGDLTEAGRLTIRGFAPTGDISLRCRFDATGNGELKTSGTVSLPTGGMKMTVRLVDLTEGKRAFSKSETFTLFDYSTANKLERVDTNHITFDLVNESPKRLDISNATVTLDTASKKILLSGVKSRRGIVIVVK